MMRASLAPRPPWRTSRRTLFAIEERKGPSLARGARIRRRVAGLARGARPAVEGPAAAVREGPAGRPLGVARRRRAAALVHDAAALARLRRRARPAVEQVPTSVRDLTAAGAGPRARRRRAGLPLLAAVRGAGADADLVAASGRSALPTFERAPAAVEH